MATEPMETIRFRRWELRTDPDATRRAYAATEIGWAEYCGCVHCRNFRLARGVAYPPEVLDLFGSLGIDRERELEVLPYRVDDASHYRYSGSFQFVGAIASGPDFWNERPGGGLVTNPDGFEDLGDGFVLGFTSRLTRRVKTFRAASLAQVEFVARVPWLLERRIPDLPR